MIQWTPGIKLEQAEQTCIEQAFKFYCSNKTQTADALGIAIRTLDAKLEKYENDRNKEQSRVDELKRERDAFIFRSRGQVAGPQSIPGSDAGFHMEPAVKVAAQPVMPMSERKEVQEVLPKHSSKSGHKRAG